MGTVAPPCAQLLAALDVLQPSTAGAGIDDATEDILRGIMSAHVVGGVRRYSSFRDGLVLTTFGGDTLTLYLQPGKTPPDDVARSADPGRTASARHATAPPRPPQAGRSSPPRQGTS
ncbi:unnamed protein product [Pedinophyceae sp. YPF-701]|nr:unnamed protein product [Pedinophyceae sp. YPF-701]